MRQALAPILFHDHDPQAAEAARQDIVSPAHRSPRAQCKDNTKRTADGMPVQSFQSLLKDLATLSQPSPDRGTDRADVGDPYSRATTRARIARRLPRAVAVPSRLHPKTLPTFIDSIG